MLMEPAAANRRVRAPQEDGQKLIEPPRPLLAATVEQNRGRLAEWSCDLQGRPIAELAAAARRAVLAQAVTYTAAYRDVSNSASLAGQAENSPIVFSGHQPELFHPGVWHKNFVLGDLAREVDGVGVHLLIDSDLCRRASIRVPTGSLDDPHTVEVAYDSLMDEVPYEERPVCDERALVEFPARVADAIRPLVDEPLVHELWRYLPRRGDVPLGRRLAQARHALEADFGNHTLELPQSAVCQLPEFAHFVAHLLAHLPRFWAAHNEALATYRRTHGLRNLAQPVPDLAENDHWLEAPLWLWTADDPRRRPLFARQRGDDLEVTDRQHVRFSLPLAADRDAGPAVEQLLAIQQRGIKIRTRALSTTLFARLFLCDLFLHGIGGAKYDHVTDEIARRFFGIEPPEYATVSATLRLPLRCEWPDLDQQRSARQALRELDFHPERFLDRNGSASSNSATRELVSEKRRWIDIPKTAENAAQRHAAIVAANQALQPYVASQRRELEARHDLLHKRLAARAIVQSREFSFCLFPRRHIVERLLDG